MRASPSWNVTLTFSRRARFLARRIRYRERSTPVTFLNPRGASSRQCRPWPQQRSRIRSLCSQPGVPADQVDLVGRVLVVLDDIAVCLEIDGVEQRPPPVAGQVAFQVGDGSDRFRRAVGCSGFLSHFAVTFMAEYRVSQPLTHPAPRAGRAQHTYGYVQQVIPLPLAASARLQRLRSRSLRPGQPARFGSCTGVRRPFRPTPGGPGEPRGSLPGVGRTIHDHGSPVGRFEPVLIAGPTDRTRRTRPLSKPPALRSDLPPIRPASLPGTGRARRAIKPIILISRSAVYFNRPSEKIL